MLAVVDFPKIPPINPDRPKMALRRFDAWVKHREFDTHTLTKQCAMVRLAIREYELNRKTDAAPSSRKALVAAIKKLEGML